MNHKPEANLVREQRVRECAYHLWEADGKPHGRDVEYWQRARELVTMEDGGSADLPPDPGTHPGSAGETGAQDAEIQANIQPDTQADPDIQADPGDPGDLLADRTDAQPPPTTRRSPARRRKAPASPAKKPKAP